MISERLTSRRTHSTNTTWGVLKISLAEATYVIQDSQIGDWELAIKNMALSNDEDGLHKITHPFGFKLSTPMG
jgi:hypothetical protein